MILLFKSYKWYCKENLSHKSLFCTSMCFHMKTCWRGNFKVLHKNQFSLLLCGIESINNILKMEKRMAWITNRFSSTKLFQRWTQSHVRHGCDSFLHFTHMPRGHIPIPLSHPFSSGILEMNLKISPGSKNNIFEWIVFWTELLTKKYIGILQLCQTIFWYI